MVGGQWCGNLVVLKFFIIKGKKGSILKTEVNHLVTKI